MKKIFLFLTTILLSLSFTACQDMLDVDSDRHPFDDDVDLNGPYDSYPVIAGILTELQKVGDRYVIMGELRSDLMKTSDFASVSLKEINDFHITSENVYADQRDYYNIINNCNFAIQKMDTSLVIRNEKTLIPAFAEIKAIRAWTYLQMAQIFGKVSYIEKPILSLEASLQEYPVIGMDELVDLLITDLLPYVNVPSPNIGSQAPNNFIPIRALLADMYLYQNNYALAAKMYYDCIYERSAIISSSYATRWTNVSLSAIFVAHPEAYRHFGDGSEIISTLYYSTYVKDFHSNLVDLTYDYKASLLPAQQFIDSMAIAPYFYAADIKSAILTTTEGDLRGNVKPTKTFSNQLGDAYNYITMKDGGQQSMALIYKFVNASQSSSGFNPNNTLLPNLRYLINLPLLRIPHLYLRYAEAVNRMGKPSLAFATLKYGLTKDNIYGIKDPNGNYTKLPVVNSSEVASGESYVNFTDGRFSNNYPTAARGRGYGIPSDTKYFVIPNYTRYVNGIDDKGNPIKVPSQNPADLAAARQDSINWVELRIVDEMAAETAFEGNRFFDLLRISRHRPNHPEFMADKVSRKYPIPATMKAKLMNMDNWYVK